MQKNITRRSFLKKSLGSIFGFAGLCFGGRYYAHDIEPNWIEIKHLQMKERLIPAGFDGLKIVQFSDTHVGFQFQLENLEKVIKTINDQQPDIIIFSGDLMDEPNKYRHLEKLVSVLSKLHAPMGKYCVYGNHDHGGYGSEIYQNVMVSADFQVLQNTHKTVSLLSGESIYIAGIDDAMLGKPDIPTAVASIPKNSYTIMISHAPDLAEKAAEQNVQLQLSGHSHGGQVQLPFVGALVKVPYAEKYHEGKYDIQSLKLYVNRGLGTTRLPYRFFSRPEITVIELQHES